MAAGVEVVPRRARGRERASGERRQRWQPASRWSREGHVGAIALAGERLFDRPLDLPLGLALRDRRALVVLPLALAHRQLDLDLAALVIQPQRNERVAALGRLRRQPTDLARMQQELAWPPRFVIPAIALVE